MAKYRCSVCGYIYDEEAEGAPFSTLSECPVCHQPTEKFTLYREDRGAEPVRPKALKLDYPKAKANRLPWAPNCRCQTGMRF